MPWCGNLCRVRLIQQHVYQLKSVRINFSSATVRYSSCKLWMTRSNDGIRLNLLHYINRKVVATHCIKRYLPSTPEWVHRKRNGVCTGIGIAGVCHFQIISFWRKYAGHSNAAAENRLSNYRCHSHWQRCCRSAEGKVERASLQVLLLKSNWSWVKKIEGDEMPGWYRL